MRRKLQAQRLPVVLTAVLGIPDLRVSIITGVLLAYELRLRHGAGGCIAFRLQPLPAEVAAFITAPAAVLPLN